MNSYTEFATHTGIIDSKFGLSDIDFNMKATLYSEIKNNPRNPANALVRFQWLEIIVRIAIDKYYKTGICDYHKDAVKMLMDTHLLPVMKQYSSEEWRWDLYICEEVDLVLKAYLPILQYIYKRYSGGKCKPGQKPYMSLDEFNELCISA
jgi:hypothetical protein